MSASQKLHAWLPQREKNASWMPQAMVTTTEALSLRVELDVINVPLGGQPPDWCRKKGR
jgi:hypothetical protein